MYKTVAGTAMPTPPTRIPFLGDPHEEQNASYMCSPVSLMLLQCHNMSGCPTSIVESIRTEFDATGAKPL